MIDSITKAKNVTVILVAELPLNVNAVGFGVEEFMADSIVMMRYVEVNGTIKRCIAVMKMRETSHDMNIHEYIIGPKGMEVKGKMTVIPLLMNCENSELIYTINADSPPDYSEYYDDISTGEKPISGGSSMKSP